MAYVEIAPRNHTNKDNDNFVGMCFSNAGKKENGTVEAIFPLGYGIDHNQVKLRKDLLFLLSTINKNSNTNKAEILSFQKESDDFPFSAYITIIQMFMQNGYYIENEIKFQQSQNGKIDWKRTIDNIKPIIQENNVVYPDFIIRKTSPNNNNMISLIHEWCVFEAFETIGWLFTPFNPRKPKLKITDNKEYFACIIQETLKTTFNDKNKRLFNAMLSMLLFKRNENTNSFFLGTTHFHTVWENVINKTFGIPDKKAYLPPAKWTFNDGRVKSNDLYPDTIMLNEKEIFVLDAKYYSFIGNAQNVPAASDINKQITYGNYIAKKFKNDYVFNAFLIPYNFLTDPHELGTRKCEERYFYIGHASLEELSSKDYKQSHVLGILVDTRWLLENAGKIDKRDLANFIKSKAKD